MSKPREFWISNTENSRGEKSTIGIWAHEKVIETMIKVVPKSAADKLAEALEFYTDLNNLSGHLGPDEHNEGWNGLDEIPYGTTAKQALAEYRGKDEQTE